MTINEYLEDNILLLTASPVVDRIQITKRRETENDGYFRARAKLIDEGLLEISSYCRYEEGATRLIEYRFHWQDKDANLIMRWDNAKHHQTLKTFPYHIHMGKDATVGECEGIDLSGVLNKIASAIDKDRDS